MASPRQRLTPRSQDLFDVEFANSFLHADVLDGVADLVAQAQLNRQRIEQDERRRDVRRVDLDIFQTEHPRPKWLACFQVLNPIELERVRYLAKNSFGNFQSLSGELVNFVFRLEETRKRDEDRHNGRRQNIRTKVSR